MPDKVYDFAIVGAGIAGASIAAELSAVADVVMLEAEALPGYHATGRSAAFWEECYGGPQIAPLTLASGPFLRDNGFLSPRGALYIGRQCDSDALDAFEDRFAGTQTSFTRIARSALSQKVPGLAQEWRDAIWQPDCADIDVAAVHEHYLRLAKARGALLRTNFRVAYITGNQGVWSLSDAKGASVKARQIVNAAGAWADDLARMAGVAPIGIVPMRRTVAQLRVDPAPPATMPLVLDINGAFYFKPESGRLWLSPHDETPSDACDAAPEELAVAEAIEQLRAVVDWQVEAVERRWAGLRSFAPDRLPVFGPDPRVSGFHWFAGQGGFGIQTAPAAAHIAAAMILRRAPSANFASIDPALYAAGRFAQPIT